MDLDAATVKLTDLASCGGCAAKYAAARLAELLQGFVPGEAENLPGLLSQLHERIR